MIANIIPFLYPIFIVVLGPNVKIFGLLPRMELQAGSTDYIGLLLPRVRKHVRMKNNIAKMELGLRCVTSIP